MSTPKWWAAAHKAWNEQEPTRHRYKQCVSMPVVWYARAWPWPDQKPYVGVGPTRQAALDNLREILTKALSEGEK